MDPSITHGNAQDMLGAAVLANTIIEVFKWLRFIPWVNRNSDRLNRILSVIIAVGYTAGFHFAVSGSFSTGGSITFTFPALKTLLDVLVDSAGSYGLQEIVYRHAMKPMVTK